MTVIIKVELKNSARHEPPEALKRIVQGRMDAMIQNDPVMDLFVAGYTVEVE